MTKKTRDVPRIETGAKNLDALFFGGLPAGSVGVGSTFYFTLPVA